MEYDPAFPTDEVEEESADFDINAIPLPNFNTKKSKKKKSQNNLNIPLPSDFNLSKAVPSPPKMSLPPPPPPPPPEIAAPVAMPSTEEIKSFPAIQSESLTNISMSNVDAVPPIKLPPSRISMTVAKRSKVLALPVGVLNKKLDGVPPMHHHEPKKEIFLPGKSDEEELVKPAPLPPTPVNIAIPALMNLDVKHPVKQTPAQANLESLLQMTHIPQKLRSAHMISQPLVTNQQLEQQSEVQADESLTKSEKKNRSKSKSRERRSRSRSRKRSRRSRSRERKRGRSRSRRRSRSRSKHRKTERSGSKRRSRSRSRKCSKRGNGSKSRRKSRSHSRKRSRSPKQSKNRKKSPSPGSRVRSKSPKSKKNSKSNEKEAHDSKTSKTVRDKSKIDTNKSSKQSKSVNDSSNKDKGKSNDKQNLKSSHESVGSTSTPICNAESGDVNVNSNKSEVESKCSPVVENENFSDQEVQADNSLSMTSSDPAARTESATLDRIVTDTNVSQSNEFQLQATDSTIQETASSFVDTPIADSHVINKLSSELNHVEKNISDNQAEISLAPEPESSKEAPKEPQVTESSEEKVSIKRGVSTCRKNYRFRGNSDSDDSSNSTSKKPDKSSQSSKRRANNSSKRTSESGGKSDRNKSNVSQNDDQKQKLNHEVKISSKEKDLFGQTKKEKNSEHQCDVKSKRKKEATPELVLTKSPSVMMKDEDRQSRSPISQDVRNRNTSPSNRESQLLKNSPSRHRDSSSNSARCQITHSLSTSSETKPKSGKKITHHSPSNKSTSKSPCRRDNRTRRSKSISPSLNNKSKSESQNLNNNDLSTMKKSKSRDKSASPHENCTSKSGTTKPQKKLSSSTKHKLKKEGKKREHKSRSQSRSPYRKRTISDKTKRISKSPKSDNKIQTRKSRSRTRSPKGRKSSRANIKSGSGSPVHEKSKHRAIKNSSGKNKKKSPSPRRKKKGRSRSISPKAKSKNHSRNIRSSKSTSRSPIRKVKRKSKSASPSPKRKFRVRKRSEPHSSRSPSNSSSPKRTSKSRNISSSKKKRNRKSSHSPKRRIKLKSRSLSKSPQRSKRRRSRRRDSRSPHARVKRKHSPSHSPHYSPNNSRSDRHRKSSKSAVRRRQSSSSNERGRNRSRRSQSLSSPTKSAFKTRMIASFSSTSATGTSSSSRSTSQGHKDDTLKLNMSDNQLNSSGATITSQLCNLVDQNSQPVVTCPVQQLPQNYYGNYQWNTPATTMLTPNMYSTWPTSQTLSSYSLPAYPGMPGGMVQSPYHTPLPVLPSYAPPADYSQSSVPGGGSYTVQTAQYIPPLAYYPSDTPQTASYSELPNCSSEYCLDASYGVASEYTDISQLVPTSRSDDHSLPDDEMDVDDSEDDDYEQQEVDGDAEELDDVADGGSELEVNMGDEEHASLRVDDLSGDETDADEAAPVMEDNKDPEDPFSVYSNAPRPQYMHIKENESLIRSTRGRNRNKLETTKWICHCTVPNPDEAASGKKTCGEDCINRALNIECSAKCPAFELCTNRQFQEMQYAPCLPFYAGAGKGWGMKATQDIVPGTFVIEYVGEIVDFREFKRRINQYEKAGHGHHYFMALESESFIDAGTKGNWARFVNHSCEPNSETQKWNVLGKIRIGFFSKDYIKRGEEITIDYQFAQFGRTEQKCYCGTPSCKGIMGATSKQLQEKVRTKDTRMVERRISRLLNLNFLEKSEDVHLLMQVLVQECLLRNTRYALLELLSKTKNESCLKQFLQYNGLELLAAYMKDSDPKDWQMKKQLLLCLELLPVGEQKPLKTGSSLYSIVTQWSIDPQYCRHRPATNYENQQVSGDTAEDANVSVEGSSVCERRGSSSLSNDLDDDVESNASSSVGLVDNETGEKQSLEPATTQLDPTDPSIKEEVKKLARDLLENWKQLPEEIFRIPKMERQPVERCQSIEPESDHRSVLSGLQGASISWGFKTKSVSSAGKSSGHKSDNQNQGLSKRIPREEYRRLFEMYVRMEEEKKAKEAAEAEEKIKIDDTQKEDVSVTLEELNQMDPGSNEALEKMQKLLCQTIITAIEKLQSGLSPTETGLPPELYGLTQHPDINKLYDQLKQSDMTQLMTILDGGNQPDESIQLPPNWKWVRNSDSRIYYYHTVTKKTQWETPVYPWDAGEDDVNSYDFNSASAYQVSHEEIAEMYIRLKAIFKKKQKLSKLKRKKKKDRKSLKPEVKRKRAFAKEIYLIAMEILKPHRNPDCTVGLIKSDSDMKYLSKKLSQTILMKELKMVRHLDDLEVNTNVRSKAHTYIEKYISSRGPVYERHNKSSQKAGTVDSNNKLRQESVSFETAEDANNSPLVEFSP